MTSVTEKTGAIHAHPLLKVEKDARAQFVSCFASLKLEFDPSTDGKNLDIWLRDNKTETDQ